LASIMISSITVQYSGLLKTMDDAVEDRDGWCRLPDDVLGVIFSFVGATHPRTLFLAVPMVCRTWRDACRLKTSAELDMNSIAELGIESPLDVLMPALSSRLRVAKLPKLTLNCWPSHAGNYGVSDGLLRVNRSFPTPSSR
jgi:hypothetical protein